MYQSLQLKVSKIESLPLLLLSTAARGQNYVPVMLIIDNNLFLLVCITNFENKILILKNFNIELGNTKPLWEQVSWLVFWRQSTAWWRELNQTLVHLKAFYFGLSSK